MRFLRFADYTPLVSVGGRLTDLEPRPHEDAYRRRIEPVVRDAGALEAARHQFEDSVARLETALASALPEAHVARKRVDAVVVRPALEGEREARAERRPASPGYDPSTIPA